MSIGVTWPITTRPVKQQFELLRNKRHTMTLLRAFVPSLATVLHHWPLAILLNTRPSESMIQ